MCAAQSLNSPGCPTGRERCAGQGRGSKAARQGRTAYGSPGETRSAPHPVYGPRGVWRGGRGAASLGLPSGSYCDFSSLVRSGRARCLQLPQGAHRAQKGARSGSNAPRGPPDPPDQPTKKGGSRTPLPPSAAVCQETQVLASLAFGQNRTLANFQIGRPGARGKAGGGNKGNTYVSNHRNDRTRPKTGESGAPLPLQCEPSAKRHRSWQASPSGKTKRSPIFKLGVLTLGGTLGVRGVDPTVCHITGPPPRATDHGPDRPIETQKGNTWK